MSTTGSKTDGEMCCGSKTLLAAVLLPFSLFSPLVLARHDLGLRSPSTRGVRVAGLGFSFGWRSGNFSFFSLSLTFILI